MTNQLCTDCDTVSQCSKTGCVPKQQTKLPDAKIKELYWCLRNMMDGFSDMAAPDGYMEGAVTPQDYLTTSKLLTELKGVFENGRS